MDVLRYMRVSILYMEVARGKLHLAELGRGSWFDFYGRVRIGDMILNGTLCTLF